MSSGRRPRSGSGSSSGADREATRSAREASRNAATPRQPPAALRSRISHRRISCGRPDPDGRGPAAAPALGSRLADPGRGSRGDHRDHLRRPRRPRLGAVHDRDRGSLHVRVVGVTRALAAGDRSRIRGACGDGDRRALRDRQGRDGGRGRHPAGHVPGRHRAGSARRRHGLGGRHAARCLVARQSHSLTPSCCAACHTATGSSST